MKALFSSVWHILMKKFFFLILVPFYNFVQKVLFTTNPNFRLDLPFFEFVEKSKFSKYFWGSFWESQFFY